MISRRGSYPIPKSQWGSVRIIDRSFKHLVSQRGIHLSTHTGTKGQRGSVRIIDRSRKHLVSHRGTRLSTHTGHIGTKGERGSVTETLSIVCQPGAIAVSRIVGTTTFNEPLNATNTSKVGHGPDRIRVDNHTTDILAVILVQTQTRRLTVNISKVPIFDGGLLCFGHPGEVSTSRPGRNETGSSRIGQTVSTELQTTTITFVVQGVPVTTALASYQTDALGPRGVGRATPIRGGSTVPLHDLIGSSRGGPETRCTQRTQCSLGKVRIDHTLGLQILNAPASICFRPEGPACEVDQFTGIVCIASDPHEVLMLDTTLGILHLTNITTRQIAIKIIGVNTCTAKQFSIGRGDGLSARKITLPSKLLGLVDQRVRFLLGIVGHVLSPIGDAGAIQSILGGFGPNTSQLAIQKDTRLSIGETKGFW